MARRSCDGAGLLRTFEAAVAQLESHVDEVNALNVFPVPDGDTGSNMLATVRAAVEAGRHLAEAGPEPAADRIAAAVAHGALMGARGNSGVITSQILRGFAEDLDGKRHFNGLDLAHALRQGARTAYGAVARPVEGTILTVIRESAEAAVDRAELSNDLEAVLAAAVEAAQGSVARTPTLLPVLHEAGVVDSGGQGLYRLLEGALLHVAGGGTAIAPHAMAPSSAAQPAVVATHGDEGFGYETMFLVQAGPGAVLDVDAIRMHLETIGDSVLVAGDARAVKVHVHNERPDLVIGFGLSIGALSRISVENLDHQAQEVREERAARFTGEAPAGGQIGGPGPRGTGEADPARPDGSELVALAVATPRPPEAASGRIAASGSDGGAARVQAVPAIRGTLGNGTTSESLLPLGVVAVAPGDGLVEVFEQFAVPDQLVIGVVRGGQSDNPSTGELLSAIAALPARQVLILPNNPNVILAARQVAELSDRPCQVVPTRNAAEGVAALLALDPVADAAFNVTAMTKAGRAIQTVQVTEAVRDARIGGRKVRKGQTIALDPDDGLVAAERDVQRAVLAAIRAFTPGFELVTLYYGDGADLDEAEDVARRVGAVLPGAEVQLIHGGQPHYRYLISAE